jgi:hypothetical protein
MTSPGLPLEEHILLTTLEKGLATQPPPQLGSPVLVDLAKKVIQYGDKEEHFLLRRVSYCLLNVRLPWYLGRFTCLCSIY